MRTLHTLGEQGLIRAIQQWLGTQQDRCVLGIGDDAAVLPSHRSTHSLLVSTDALIEHVHFTRHTTSFFELGWKALAVNISDIAAMGGIPRYALVTCAVTKNVTLHDLKQLYRGFKHLADKAKVQLIGGDTVASRRDMMVSVTILGNTSYKPLLRSGAQPGDALCVTGTWGDAGYGLYSLLNTKKCTRYFAQRFNQPMPRWHEAHVIARKGYASSMMDASDGLVSSVFELMRQSHCGCELHYSAVPLSQRILRVLSRQQALTYALHSGEDYELVFTVPQHTVAALQKLIPAVTVVGVVTKRLTMYAIDLNGKRIPWVNKGYDALKSINN